MKPLQKAFIFTIEGEEKHWTIPLAKCKHCSTIKHLKFHYLPIDLHCLQKTKTLHIYGAIGRTAVFAIGQLQFESCVHTKHSTDKFILLTRLNNGKCLTKENGLTEVPILKNALNVYKIYGLNPASFSSSSQYDYKYNVNFDY